MCRGGPTLKLIFNVCRSVGAVGRRNTALLLLGRAVPLKSRRMISPEMADRARPSTSVYLFYRFVGGEKRVGKLRTGFPTPPPPRGIRIIRYRVRALLMEKAYLIRSLSFLIIPKLNLNYHLYRNLKARFEHPTGWRPPHETDVKISGGSIPLMTSKEMRVAVGRLCVCRAVTRRAPDESEALRHSKR